MALGSHPAWVYQVVQLKGGIGVLVSGNEAYFVRSGKVFAVNGAAKAASPELGYVEDTGITYGSIAALLSGVPSASLSDIAKRNSGERIPGTPDCAK